jgi:hypothetical protein
MPGDCEQYPSAYAASAVRPDLQRQQAALRPLVTASRCDRRQTILLAASASPWLRDHATRPRSSAARSSFMPGERLEDAVAALVEQSRASASSRDSVNLTRMEDAEKVTEHYLGVRQRR